MPNETKNINIYISDDLRDVLRSIESESEVASLLLKIRHNKESLTDSYVNYISISKQDRTKLSYLSKDRVDTLDPHEYWTSSRRYIAKPGAFISKLFNNISAKEVEKFSNLFRSQAAKAPFRFELVKGSSIKDFYYYESYQSSERGSLGVSCMKHEHCQKFFDLYTENEENISMLAMFNDKNRLIGRALLWDFDSHKIMDRIYTYNDEELSFYFKQWATEHGYFYKSEQNWFNTLFFEQIGSGKKEFKLEVKLPNVKQHYYPYMDTFKFIDLDKGILYNYIPEDTSSLRTLTSSDGGKHPSDYLVLDQIDQVMRYRNDAVYITYTDFWTGRQNAVYSNYNDKWILTKDSRYENLLDDYIFNEENYNKNNERVLKLIEQRQKEEDARQEAYKNLKGKDKKLTKEDLTIDDLASSIRGWGNMHGGMPSGHELRDVLLRTRTQLGRPRRNERVDREDQEVARPTGTHQRETQNIFAVDYQDTLFDVRAQEETNTPIVEGREVPIQHDSEPATPEDMSTQELRESLVDARGRYYDYNSSWTSVDLDWSSLTDNEDPF